MDIKKIFETLYGNQRREWTDGSGDNENGWEEQRPRIPNIRMPRISRIWIILGGFFLLFTVILPGLAIFITVLAFNLLGDGLRDALDPKLRT